MDTPASLLLVDPHTRADLLKTPGGSDACFRSVFLTFPATLLDGFQLAYPGRWTGPRPAVPFRSVALDGDLAATLRHTLESVEDGALSDEWLRHRLMDLLLALAERGHGFGHTGPESTSERLRTLIGEAPERHWTAKAAGQALAMSPATLRRRLAGEQARFEDLLIDVRMHHAMMLVQTTGWGMARIAQACGYQSRARFTERFHERFGYLPSTVR